MEVGETAGLQPIPAGAVAIPCQLVEVVHTDREVEAIIGGAFHQ